jgi:predicted  nucleic acid-binding Zn-ribbon protein
MSAWERPGALMRRKITDGRPGGPAVASCGPAAPVPLPQDTTMDFARRLLLPLLFAGLAGGAFAQGAATKSIGTAKGGKLLTFDELRACLAQQKDLGARKPRLEGERAALEKERDELQKIDQSLKADEAAMQKLAQQAEDITKRTKELQQQINDYNDKSAQMQNAPLSGPMADRQRRNLQSEKAAIDRATAQLEADRAALGPDAEQKAKTYQARAETRNRAVDDWNARNQNLAKQTQAYETDLQTWKIDCEGRSYREDDEKLIQSGK